MSTKKTVESAEEEIAIDVHVSMEENTEGNVEPERRVLKFQRADTDLQAPGQQRLSSWEKQRITANRSSDLGRTISFEPLLEWNPITKLHSFPYLAKLSSCR